MPARRQTPKQVDSGWASGGLACAWCWLRKSLLPRAPSWLCLPSTGRKEACLRPLVYQVSVYQEHNPAGGS